MNSEKLKISDLNYVLFLFKKEFLSFCTMPVLYGAALFFVLGSGLLFIGGTSWFYAGQSDLRAFFLNIPILCCVVIPMFTMSIWADEKKQHTDKLLFSFPISIRGIVLAKYLSLIAAWFLLLILSAVIPVSVFRLGYFSLSSFFLSYCAVFFFGSGVIAFSSALSSLTSHSAINFLLSFLTVLFFTFIHTALFKTENLNFIKTVLNYLSFTLHFESSARGIFDSRDFVFYFVLIALGIELNVFILQIQRSSR